MTDFTVWAPLAGRIDLLIDGSLVGMDQEPGGWWRARAGARPGSRYGYSLDDGPVRPDPRSQSQPDGVEGLSEVLDPGFPWTDDGWCGFEWRGAVLYELHVGTFTAAGTFDGVIERLGHLVDLGVDAVELMPVAEFSGTRGWGYDGVDLFAAHHAYGGPDGLRRLVDACHRAGLGVILDVVYNHLGPAGNHLGAFGPYFSSAHQTAWGDAVNFDGPGSDEVRRFVIDNATGWLRDFHVDGLRLDAVHAIKDDAALSILEELAGVVDGLAADLGRPLHLIAESERNDPRYVRSRSAGGFGLDAVWADDWHHALHAVLTNERQGYYVDFGSYEALAKALRQAWVYDGAYSAHRQRRHGRSPAGLAGPQFVVCTQNHDQVGNRAQGDRPTVTLSEGRVRIAAALLLTSPFTPMLFQGEEWAAVTPFQYFTAHEDPALAAAVSTGRRREFAAFDWSPDQVPDPQETATFERSVLQWADLDRPRHAVHLDWCRQLIAFRRAHPDLTEPDLADVEVSADPERQVVTTGRGAVRVVANLGPAVRTVPVPPGWRVALASTPCSPPDRDGLHLPGESVVVLEGGPPGIDAPAAGS